jgi:hypothetical protein
MHAEMPLRALYLWEWARDGSGALWISRATGFEMQFPPHNHHLQYIVTKQSANFQQNI